MHQKIEIKALKYSLKWSEWSGLIFDIDRSKLQVNFQHLQCIFHIVHVSSRHMFLTIKLEPAESWRENLMIYLTNRVYHRRALSYWFHIMCNSLYLPSRPFSSPACFMWLRPFLIVVTDRRSAEKDRENERESGDFVTGELVNAVGWVRVWTSPDIFPIDSNPHPPPILSILSLMRAEGCVIPVKKKKKKKKGPKRSIRVWLNILS